MAATRSYGTYRVVETYNVGTTEQASGTIMNGYESRDAAIAALKTETDTLLADGCLAIPAEEWETLMQLPDGGRVGYQVLLNVWRDA